jgi:iron complex outermembrane receptor protein
MKKTMCRPWACPVSRAGRNAIFSAASGLFLAGLAASAADLASTNAPPDQTPAADAKLSQLSNLSIEQLMQVKVTILGPSETVSKTPAAVSVVTADDIRRSGAQSIPEALRLVPGLDVAQIDGSQWAVSSRGFNSEFANKLLVLQDGRSIYTPLFGGVLWDVQGAMMEDIDRIEVIRGPGATLWGANAVDGVINILSKSAQDTQGWLVSGGGGTFDQGFADARYGGKIGDNAFYRVYGTYMDHAATPLPNGEDSRTDWQLGRGGFRVDWNRSPDDLLTFQGDGYGGAGHEVFWVAPTSTTFAATPENVQLQGADVLGRWTHTVSDTSDFKLQLYYDLTERDMPQVMDETRHAVDLTFQHQFAAGDRNHLIWGLGYRVNNDTEINTPTMAFAADRQTLNIFSGFAQDEIALVKDRLGLTLGSKVEDNGYTGFEFEPGARLLWTPAEHHSFWVSVSRAVRTPDRNDNGIILSQPPGVTLYGNSGLESERLMAYEIGYRVQPVEKLSFDLAGFYNDYDRLESVEFGQSPTQLPTVPGTIPMHDGNDLAGASFGGEVSATWKLTDWWRLRPGYSFLKMNLHTRPGSTDTSSVALAENESPQNQFSLRTMMDFPHDVSFDLTVRYVDRLALPAPFTPVGSYVTADARLAWRASKNLEFSIVGQSLLQKQHAESSSTELLGNPQTQIPRSVYAKITWQF